MGSWLSWLALIIACTSVYISVRLLPRRFMQGRRLEAIALLQLLVTGRQLGWDIDDRLLLAFMVHCQDDLGFTATSTGFGLGPDSAT